MRYSQVISVFQREPSITSCVYLFSSRRAGLLLGCGIRGLVGCLCQALLCIFTPKDSLCLCLCRDLASSRVAGSAPRAAQQGCSGESTSVGCPTTGAGTSGQADLSLAGRLMITLLLLLCGCSGWDLDVCGLSAQVPLQLKRESAAQSTGIKMTCYC